MGIINSKFKTITHKSDLCIIGGGMSGFTMALSAARHGIKVVLMHDRPVLGGNASSECRVQIAGADCLNKNKNLRETGILEELRLENCRRNQNANYSIWDLILIEKILLEPNIELVANCSCCDAETNDSSITSITGWQTTTQSIHKVLSRLYADCSGDAVLAPLTGASFNIGREARHVSNESIAPLESDSKTMGMSLIMQSREYNSNQVFLPSPIGKNFANDSFLPCGEEGHKNLAEGYWWNELGGEQDSIMDTEHLRDKLLKNLVGIWDHIKNINNHNASNLALDWIQFLPAKRESRRYVGEYVLNQNDIQEGGVFEDVVAYGGWPMDDHHPAGFNAFKINAPATIFHPAPSPYGIPYRCLYSKNINNLFCGGRCISVTHAALSSTRVIGTCMSTAQATGTAAAMAIQKNLMPHDINMHINELQNTLLEDDCYIPDIMLASSPLQSKAKIKASSAYPDCLKAGFTRQVGDESNAWECTAGDWVEYSFDSMENIESINIIFDSQLDKFIALIPNNPGCRTIPERLISQFTISGYRNGQECILKKETDNYKRQIKLILNKNFDRIRLTIDTISNNSAHSAINLFSIK